MRDLANEYLEGADGLEPFFSGPPRTLSDTPPERKSWRPELAAELKHYQRSIGGDASFRGDEAVLATGQQPGMFAGPLYTIYKAATAVRVARMVSERTGAACVPLFWVGADDHDFDEAKRIHLLDKNDEPWEMVYRPESDVAGLPMHRVPVEPSLHGHAGEAAARARSSELRGEVADFLHDSIDAAVSYADWTARLLARLFRGTGLVVFSPDLAAARRAAVPVFSREIEHPRETARLLNEAGSRLRDLDFPQQVEKDARDCSFFLEVEGRRRKVVFEEGRFALPETGQAFTADELHAVLDAEPERFSPNVALRCIVQQELFPVAAYVAGPGETAYWAQMKPVFDAAGQRMPIVYPRARCTLVRAKWEKLRRKLGLGLDELDCSQEEIMDHALRTGVDNPARRSLEEGRERVETALQGLVEALEKDDQEAADMVQAVAEHAREGLDRVDTALTRRDEVRVEAIRGQVERLTNALVPWRRPQERVYTVFSFLFEHGWQLVPRLVDELDVESFGMNEVQI